MEASVVGVGGVGRGLYRGVGGVCRAQRVGGGCAVGRAVEDGADGGGKGVCLAGLVGRTGREEGRRRGRMMGVGLMKLELMSDRRAALALNLRIRDPIHASLTRSVGRNE